MNSSALSTSEARLAWRMLSLPIALKLVAVSFAVAILFTLLIYFHFRANRAAAIYAREEKEAQAFAHLLSEALEQSLLNGDLDTARQKLSHVRQDFPDILYLLVRDHTGRLVASSPAPFPADCPLPPSLSPARDFPVQRRAVTGGLILETAGPLAGKAEALGFIQLGMSDRFARQRIASLSRSMPTSGAGPPWCASPSRTTC